MAQRGYLGIHAEVPTAQHLRSAIVVNGASRSKAKAKAKAKARRFTADLSLSGVRRSIVGAGLPAKAAL